MTHGGDQVWSQTLGVAPHFCRDNICCCCSLFTIQQRREDLQVGGLDALLQAVLHLHETLDSLLQGLAPPDLPHRALGCPGYLHTAAGNAVSRRPSTDVPVQVGGGVPGCPADFPMQTSPHTALGDQDSSWMVSCCRRLSCTSS